MRPNLTGESFGWLSTQVERSVAERVGPTNAFIDLNKYVEAV